MAAILAGAALLYAWSYWRIPTRPVAADPASGWWGFSDLGRYLAATIAWSHWEFDPAQHWYLPGYPLLAVPFRWVTPADPFLLPDCALFLVSLWLMGAIAVRLMPTWRAARVLGALAFLATAAIPAAMTAWVMPWTTTPATALTLSCLLALLRLADAPGSWGLAMAAALPAASLAAIRPADSALMLAVAGGSTVACVARSGLGWMTRLRSILAFALAAALPLGATLATYLAIYGPHLSPYLAYSADLGFEWRLLPLRWVMLVLDPQPVLPDGEGLLPTFPFIATGMAGMATIMVTGKGGRAKHAIVAGSALAYGALYLCYRDLHPQGLWTFFNYHYFKWLLPIFGLYTILLVSSLHRPRAVATGLCVLVAVLPWRARLVLLPGLAAEVSSPHGIAIAPGLAIGQGLVVAATGTFATIYDGANTFIFGADGAQGYTSKGGIASDPLPGGFMLVPLRPIVPGPGHAMIDPAIRLDASVPIQKTRFAFSYGLPCYLPAWLVHPDPSCRSDGPIPAPVRPLGQPIPFDATVANLLISGWTKGSGDDEYSTEGHRAALHLRLRPMPEQATLTVVGTAFIPYGSPPMDLALEAGGSVRGRWHLADAGIVSLRVSLPPDAFGPDGLLDLTILVANPRRPLDWIGGYDKRAIGLRVRSLLIE